LAIATRRAFDGAAHVPASEVEDGERVVLSGRRRIDLLPASPWAFLASGGDIKKLIKTTSYR
jgi:hypothetical protein